MTMQHNRGVGHATWLVACLLFTTVSAVSAAEFPWQEPHAKVDAQGDLAWDPVPFEFEMGESIRYIDFESGSDAADGRSPETA